MKTLQQLKQGRVEAFQLMEQITAAAERRSMTAAEIEEWSSLKETFDRLSGQIELLEPNAQRATLDNMRDGPGISPVDPARLHGDRSKRRGPLEPGEIRTLARADRFADLLPSGTAGAEIGWGQFLRGIVTGDWTGVSAEVRAQSIGQDAGGGYLTPDALAARVIDRARNLATVFRAGAVTVPMETSEVHMARVAGDPTAGWKLENVPGAASDLTFERVTLRAKTVMALVKGSVELLEDSPTAAQTIENAMAEALALELDRAALRGSGAAGEPLGIVGQTGVTTTGSIGSPSDYVKFADDPVRDLRLANAEEPFSFISSPRTFHSLGKIVTGIASDKSRLKPPADWDAFQRLSTNQVPVNLGAGTNESQAFVGDFRQLLVGMRTTLTIEATRVGADGNSSAFSDLQVWVRAYLRADIALAHPQHFVVLDGILA